jgi:glutathione S-transferase
MDLAAHAYSLSAIVTILAAILYMYMGITVGSARAKYKIDAPAVTGNPEFERTYRVQVNTLESMPVFLPGLWLATYFFTMLAWLPAAIGLIWVIGRFMYMQGYIAAASKRSTGFLISALAQIVLLLLAIVGIVNAWGVA